MKKSTSINKPIANWITMSIEVQVFVKEATREEENIFCNQSSPFFLEDKTVCQADGIEDRWRLG